MAVKTKCTFSFTNKL